MEQANRLSLVLLLLRLSVFIVMLMWTVDKFIRPQHASEVYKHFYQISGLGNTFFYGVAALETLLLVGFLLGIKKKWTYGTVLLLHGISTLSSYKQYLSPFESVHLLFYAAWPMLAACFALFYLRDLDTRWVVGKD